MQKIDLAKKKRINYLFWAIIISSSLFKSCIILVAWVCHPLRSMPITDTSTLLRGNPPQRRTSVHFLPCTSLSAFPLAFRLLLPTFHQRACITVLPPLCRMPQCHRQVIVLLVARTVRHWLLTWLETGLTFPTAAACRGFDASACTPTPRDLLSSHW